ncbi:DUF3310 domain-containing protein [Corynebacterium sp. CNJ-954]|uniref:DUF3310 domain-containing protein n=1 Tax=Corynebacterium sp. CNJ-954 TaxID=1904962 RepID=UPI00096A90FE|nr:DUF3310 domain-containing protein [Corynebacterium sp. CNJ-954]
MEEKINPQHYKRKNIEAIEVIESFFPESPHLANAFKYLSRMGRKDSEKEECGKAIWYILRYLHATGQGHPDVGEFIKLLGYENGAIVVDRSGVGECRYEVNGSRGDYIELSSAMSSVRIYD